ncbi:Clavaminate synthase-like protein [Phaeosphaeriaceae sp. SRC1lsM3a]|nr:Clavaminate synthase-like protein [Stagonospora sp. SRC1lsM3a]
MGEFQQNLESFAFEGQQQTITFGYPTNHAFPLALQTKGDWKPNVSEAVNYLESLTTSGQLLRLVQQHGGALLIRGLPITDAESYSQIAHAFGFSAHEEVGRPPVRTVLAKNVKTANEGPPELPIWPHNEYGWSTHNPAWLTFSCLDVPERGGATPIISSIGLAHRLREQAPDFFDLLLQKGVRYLYRYGREQVTSTTGASVFAAYGQEVQDGDDEETIRAKIEKEVRRHSELFEWHDDGSLSVTHIVPIIRKHVPTGLTTWFGNLTSAYGRSRHHGATQPPFRGDDGSYHPLPTYGDGSPIDNSHLEFALDIAEQMQVDVQWQKGDLVLLDNYAVMHSRRAWAGKRTVLAALWDGKIGEKDRIEDFVEGERILQGRERHGASGESAGTP